MAEQKYSKNLKAYWCRWIAKLSELANSSIASPPQLLSEIIHVLLVWTIFCSVFNYMLPKDPTNTPLNMIPAFNELSVEKVIQWFDKSNNKCVYIVAGNSLKEDGLE